MTLHVPTEDLFQVHTYTLPATRNPGVAVNISPSVRQPVLIEDGGRRFWVLRPGERGEFVTVSAPTWWQRLLDPILARLGYTREFPRWRRVR
jgi:hypothetical protein